MKNLIYKDVLDNLEFWKLIEVLHPLHLKDLVKAVNDKKKIYAGFYSEACVKWGREDLK